MEDALDSASRPDGATHALGIASRTPVDLAKSREFLEASPQHALTDRADPLGDAANLFGFALNCALSVFARMGTGSCR